MGLKVQKNTPVMTHHRRHLEKAADTGTDSRRWIGLISQSALGLDSSCISASFSPAWFCHLCSPTGTVLSIAGWPVTSATEVIEGGGSTALLESDQAERAALIVGPGDSSMGAR